MHARTQHTHARRLRRGAETKLPSRTMARLVGVCTDRWTARRRDLRPAPLSFSSSLSRPPWAALTQPCSASLLRKHALKRECARRSAPKTAGGRGLPPAPRPWQPPQRGRARPQAGTGLYGVSVRGLFRCAGAPLCSRLLPHLPRYAHGQLRPASPTSPRCVLSSVRPAWLSPRPQRLAPHTTRFLSTMKRLRPHAPRPPPLPVRLTTLQRAPPYCAEPASVQAGSPRRRPPRS